MIVTSKTNHTKEEYRKRAINLCIKAHKEASLKNIDIKRVTIIVQKDGDSYNALNVFATAKWAAINWAKEISPSTWRQYRCALRFYAEELHKEDSSISKAQIGTLESYLGNKSIQNKRKDKATSSSKKKHFNDGDLELLVKALIKKRAKNSKPLTNWLYINQFVGLRPIEWKNVSVIERNGTTLKVLNAKNTNNRSHGKYRYISLSNYSNKQQEMIVRFSEICSKINDSGRFNEFYEDCRKLLQRTCREIWPKRKKHITLYTTRHQFSADLKRSGKKLMEIAYLMGHISTDTATHHYGKKRYGKSKVTPDVNPEDLKMIKQQFLKFKFDSKPLSKSL